MTLCELASAPGSGVISVSAPALIAELVDVAELYVNPCRGDALHNMGPWWMGQPRRTISEGRASLRSADGAANTPAGTGRAD